MSTLPAIAVKLGRIKVTVAKWRNIGSLRTGSKGSPTLPGRTIGDHVVEAIVVETLESAPKGAPHWSTLALSAEHGISRQTVWEIRRAFGLKPWRQDEFQISPDADLIEKIRDIVVEFVDAQRVVGELE